MALSYPSRPTTVDDLVHRLRSDYIDQAEIDALKALSKAMISVFQDKPFLSFVPEAAALSAVARSTDYETLLRAFENTVTNGTMDVTVLNPEILLGLTRVLGYAKDNTGANIPLGSVLVSLQKRLESAMEVAESQTQYRLIDAVSSVLDVMNEVKATGLDRGQLHEPLLKKLSTLSKHEEIHLSQVASYAHQALLGIPDNEGPWAALWRNAYNVTNAGAKLAGAVFTMDPSKLLEGLVRLQDVPDLISSMIDVSKKVADFLNASRSTTEALRFSQKQKSWYVALRFTALLIHANAFGYLKDFFSRVPCLEEKGFLCGIFAQLEVAWEAGEDSARTIIFEILDEHLVPIGSQSKHGRVRAWVISIANTLHHIQWQEVLQSTQQHRFPVLSKKRNYKSEYFNLGMRNETHQGALLEEAWQRCREAHIFYADLMIHEYYAQESRLKIERLSGRPLPMSQCYINLAIIKQRTEGERIFNGAAGEQNPSPFSLLTRLNITNPPEELRASLFTLFRPQKQRDGIARSPERVFIQGQAGIGKTTLCKKMVYNYIHHRLWIDLYDRLIWIPLRKLKNRSKSCYSLKDLLYNEFFYDRLDGRLFADALWKVIRGSPARTLFILDGLDEVAQELNSQTDQLLQTLLNHSHVIITSRPYRSSLEYMDPFDLELETIGFYPDQVDAYIQKAVGNEGARDIQSFMQEHLLIQGLARIPIQLEAICYCWDGISTDVPTTMTTLYQSIELNLWRKDAWNLTKVTDRHVAQQLTRFEIIELVQAELNLLQSLAFTGLHNDIVEFDAKYLEQILQNKGHIWKYLKYPASTTVSTVLAKLSLLRTSDTSDEGHRSYHFLHLTFQEYFAAQYYVEHWKSGKTLPYLKISHRETLLESISPTSFLHREKYNPRYDVLWRFVAGMLQGHDEDHLRRFFALIEGEPRDLLGPAHQRLVMHCLSEVNSLSKTSTSTPLRENLEEQLSRWAIFEHKFNGTASLAGDMQFPESVLEAILERGSMVHKSRLVRSLPARRTSLPRFITFLTTWLREGVSPRIMASVCKVLNEHPQNLPDETLNALVGRLGDQHYSIRCSALEVLRRQENLSEWILEDVANRLKDNDSRVREAAAYTLSDSLNPAMEFIKAMTVRAIFSVDPELAESCEPVLGIQPTSLKDTLEAILSEEFIDETLLSEVFEADATPTLQKRFIEESVQEELLKIMAKFPALKDGVEETWPELLRVLEKPPFRGEILAALAERLDDKIEKDEKVRKAATDALGAHSILPDEILETIEKRLGDPESNVRQAAARALGGQAKLPGIILEAVATGLRDDASNVREATVYALGSQYNLPEKILRAVADGLNDPESTVRQAVANILGLQPNFMRVVLVLLFRRLTGEEPDREFFSEFPCNFVAYAVASLKDEDDDIKKAVRRVFTYQSTLPAAILRAMMERLNVEDGRVRRAIARALRRQLESIKETGKTMAALCEDGDTQCGDDAARVLAEQSALAKEISQALGVMMDNRESPEKTGYADVSSSKEGESPVSPATEDETPLSPTTDDEMPPSSTIEDQDLLSPTTPNENPQSSTTEDETPLSPTTDDEMPPSSTIEDQDLLSPTTPNENPQSSTTEDESSLSSATDDEDSVLLGRRSLGMGDDIIESLDKLCHLENPLIHLRPASQYKLWLNFSFESQLVLYIEDGHLCLREADQSWKLAFKSRKKQDQFMAKIQKLRADLGVPQ